MNLFTLKTSVVTISTMLISTLMISSAYSQVKGNQAANLATEAATIENKWNIVTGNPITNDSSFKISDPECKKINPIEYLNRPETFFKSCETTITPHSQNYEPIEYLKVPELDSGITVTVTNFE